MTDKLDIVGIGNAMVDAIIPSNKNEVEKNKLFFRYITGGVPISVILLLLFGCLLLLKSISGPLIALADSAARLASGDRNTPVPVRGNTDASGQIARAFDKWSQDLFDMELFFLNST